MLSPDDLITSIRPRLAAHAILTDQALLGRLEVLSDRFREQSGTEQTGGGLVSELPGLQTELDAMADEIEAATRFVVFKSLTGPEMETVKQLAPPKEAGYVLDPDSAGLPLVEAAAVGLFGTEEEAAKFISDPPADLPRVFSTDQARVLWERLPTGEQQALFEAAWSVQRRAGDPKSLTGTARTLSTALSSTGVTGRPTGPGRGFTAEPVNGPTGTETS